MAILINKQPIDPPVDKPTFNVKASLVANMKKYQNIPSVTASGQFRCSGSALDACNSDYNWRSNIRSGYKAKGLKYPAGATDSWKMKQSIKESGAGDFFYDVDRDGPLSAEDIKVMDRNLPAGSVLGWGDARGTYIPDEGDKKSRHTTTTLGTDKNFNNVHYNFGRTDKYSDSFHDYFMNEGDAADNGWVNYNNKWVKTPNYVAMPSGSSKFNINFFRPGPKLKSKTITSVPTTKSKIKINSIL